MISGFATNETLAASMTLSSISFGVRYSQRTFEIFQLCFDLCNHCRRCRRNLQIWCWGNWQFFPSLFGYTQPCRGCTFHPTNARRFFWCWPSAREGGQCPHIFCALALLILHLLLCTLFGFAFFLALISISGATPTATILGNGCSIACSSTSGSSTFCKSSCFASTFLELETRGEY